MHKQIVHRILWGIMLIVGASYLVFVDTPSGREYLDLIAIILVFYAGTLAQAATSKPILRWPWGRQTSSTKK